MVRSTLRYLSSNSKMQDAPSINGKLFTTAVLEIAISLLMVRFSVGMTLLKFGTKQKRGGLSILGADAILGKTIAADVLQSPYLTSKPSMFRLKRL